jgi:hypothetical protein
VIKRKTSRPRSKGIAETYIHIADVPRGLSKDKARQYLEQHVYAWAEQNFKNTVIVKVRVEEGSLKVWVLVGGLAIFNFVANYGSFRSGIDYLVSDARAFSDYVIEKFSEDENIPEGALLRTERRLGVPGKIQRYLKSLDKLNSPDIGQNQRQVKIEELREEFIEILELLDSPQDRELFIEEVPPNISQQPNVPLPEPIRGVISLEAIRNEED